MSRGQNETGSLSIRESVTGKTRLCGRPPANLDRVDAAVAPTVTAGLYGILEGGIEGFDVDETLHKLAIPS